MSPRRYDQRLRAEAAEETRRRILDALYERLRSQPSRPVSVDEIAQIARVARSTIYLIFGSRAGLFDALAAELFQSGEFALVEAAATHPDARESLRNAVLGGARMFAAHRDVFRVLYSIAQLDANAVGGAVQRLESGRAAGMARLAKRLAEQDLLRSDVSEADAAHVLWLLSSFDSFDVLFTGRGLSLDEVVGVQTAMAERSLYR
jgi:AcrR family transcriptional regulator